MGFLETIFIFLTITYRTIYTETFNCDGTNLVCAGQPITCTDDEACLITCTGSGDCVGSTITCPTNADCTIECHSSAGSGGCKVSSIIATNSLSLSIDNQNVAKGFQSAPIYCPFNGNCILSGNGNQAFKDVQIYATFGFVFSQVSISCGGDQCRNLITVNCGNNYQSSCIVDKTTNSCNNGPSTCDTIFTSITNTWNDDYSINPAPGWIVTDFNGNSINQIFNGTFNRYHGPFYGDQISATLDIYTLTQYFYCSTTSYVYVEYTYGFSCQEDVDFSRLYLNDQVYAEKHAQADANNNPFKDDKLEDEVATKCPDFWNKKSLNGSLGEIQANTLFKVEIQVTLNYDREASTITDFHIICNPPTNSPTTHPITTEPSTSPTTAEPTPGTIDPTTSPTMTPTTSQPSIPTKSPSRLTLSPSFNPTPATKNPTNKPTRSPLKFCKQFNKIQGFIFTDDDDFKCKFCMCNGIDAEHCGNFAEGRSAISDSMVEAFMKYCSFDSECSFDDIAFKPSAKIKECGCQMFECDPLSNYANTYTFVSGFTLVAVLSQLIILFM